MNGNRERDEKYKSSKKKYKTRSRSRSRSKSHSRSRSRDKRRRRNRRESRSASKSRSNSIARRRKGEDTKKNTEVTVNVNLTSTRVKSSNFSYNTPIEGTAPSSSTSGVQSLQPLSSAQAAKVDRKLYIGNLPTGITPSTLVKLLNTALASLKANLQPGDPVLSAWISTDGHYAFVEFRTPEEANNGFLLNNISILGQPLKVGRPKTYTGALSMSEDGSLSNTVFAALQAGTMTTPSTGIKVQFPTRILCFRNVTQEINIENEEEYKNLYEDIREECSKYGPVLSIYIPRKDVEDNPSPGMGNVYVEFQNLEQAKMARKNLVGRKYNCKFVNLVYFSEEKFQMNDFEIEDKNEQKDNVDDSIIN